MTIAFIRNTDYTTSPKRILETGLQSWHGNGLQLKTVRVQAFERMPEMYIKRHKEIVDSGKE